MIFEAGGFFEEQFLDSLSTRAPDRDRQSRQFDLGPGLWQIAEPVEDQTADGVDSVCFQFKAEMLVQIVEACVTADQKLSIFERLNVKIDFSAGRRRATENFLNDVRHGDNSFGAAKFVDHNCERLRMGQEKLEQIERAHRLRHERRGQQGFGVMFGRIEQEQFDIDDANDVVRRVGINRNAAVAFLF